MDAYLDTLVTVCKTYDSMPHGVKTEYLREQAARLNRAPQTLLGEFKRVLGWSSKRRTRSDKGATRISAGAMEFAGTLQRESVRKNGKSSMPTTVAVGITAQNGHSIDVTPDHFRRAMRERGLDVKTQTRATPHVRVRATHPNHVHEVDASMCLVYYLKNGKQGVMREDAFNKNKPHNLAGIKLKCWRYVLWDAASSAIKVRYFEAAGESQQLLLDFLIWAWATDDQSAPYGVCDMLYMDPGCAMTAYSVQALCEALGVEMRNHMPGVARATGGVESAHQIVETQFECRLLAEPVDNCAELNTAVRTWYRAYNANEISGQDCRLNRNGFRASRRDLWMTPVAGVTLRELPEASLCRALATSRPQERKVMGGLEISVKHPKAKTMRRYSVKGLDGVNVGDTVTVRPLVYGDCEIRIHVQRFDGADLAYTLQPRAELDQFGNHLDSPVWGTYESLPATINELTGKRMEALAYPGMTSDEIRKARNKSTPPLKRADGTTINAHRYLADVKVTTALPRRGETINVPDHVSVAPPTPLTHFAACKAIVGLLRRPLTTEENDQVKSWYPDGVLEDGVPMVAQCIDNGTTPFNVGRAPLRAVS